MVRVAPFLTHSVENATNRIYSTGACRENNRINQSVRNDYSHESIRYSLGLRYFYIFQIIKNQNIWTNSVECFDLDDLRMLMCQF